MYIYIYIYTFLCIHVVLFKITVYLHQDGCICASFVRIMLGACVLWHIGSLSVAQQSRRVWSVDPKQRYAQGSAATFGRLHTSGCGVDLLGPWRPRLLTEFLASRARLEHTTLQQLMLPNSFAGWSSNLVARMKDMMSKIVMMLVLTIWSCFLLTKAATDVSMLRPIAISCAVQAASRM